ncbi:class I SAM-dependent methyltransferase [Streptomycetaceae bacterium NBC_01309]
MEYANRVGALVAAARERRWRGIADRVTSLAGDLAGTAFPLGVRAWDGSGAGPSETAPVLVLRSPRAVRYALFRPGELGLARAFVAGDLDVDGDLQEALRLARTFAVSARAAGVPSPAHWPSAAALLVRLGAIGPPPGVPDTEARLRGAPHSRRRDRAAIAHHYDLGNDFYGRILDPSMSYSCAQWDDADPGQTLGEAQTAKLESICNRLELRSGQRLLDVGCGWGSLVLHAAEFHGALATGLTLSEHQARFVRARVAERGLADRVEVRVQDYREGIERGYDAVASIEMGEHVGDEYYPVYSRTLFDALRPGGRLVLQQMARGTAAPGGGPFIEAYIAPDMAMRPLHRTLSHLRHAGLDIVDVLSLREDYTRTINAWAARLHDAWDEIVHHHGAQRARVWRLYLAGSALAFESGRMDVHQALAVRPMAAAPGNPPEPHTPRTLPTPARITGPTAEAHPRGTGGVR